MRGLATPAIRLEKSEKPARSWIGGRPSIVEGVAWPERQGSPLGFLAQVDLEELQQTLEHKWLPESGTLLFFYDVQGGAWGFDPKDRGSCAVIYTTRRGEPRTVSFDERKAMGSGIKFRKIESLPSYERDAVVALNLTDEECDEWIEGTEERRADLAPEHQIGGFPVCIQSDSMELECQLVTNGLYCGDASGYNSPRVEDLAHGASAWKLLLQIDSDEEIGFFWGDCGTIYYWVKEDDARLGDFSNSWLILQCS